MWRQMKQFWNTEKIPHNLQYDSHLLCVGGVTVQKYTSVIQYCSGDIFLLLMTIADSPLLGQSASGLNFYDYSGRSPLAD